MVKVLKSTVNNFYYPIKTDSLGCQSHKKNLTGFRNLLGLMRSFMGPKAIFYKFLLFYLLKI